MKNKLFLLINLWGRRIEDPLGIVDTSPPSFAGGILERKITERLWKFAQRRFLDIEVLRTHLYFLYYPASALVGVTDQVQIEECDQVFNLFYDRRTLTEELEELLQEFLAEWAEAGELIITSEWLIIWFGVKLLQEDRVCSNLDTRYTPNQRALFYSRFAAYFLYVLFLLRYFGEPQLFHFSDIPEGYEGFLDAALFLMAEYTHEVEGLPRRIPLYQVLNDNWANEAVLYTVQDNYRDHHHHVWNVCLLGLVMIEAGLLDRLKPNWNAPKKKERQLKRNWILAGLLHDIGYGLHLNHHLMNHLKYLRVSPCLSNYHDQVSQHLAREEKNLCKKISPLFRFGHEREIPDHGMVSAVYLLFLEKAYLKAGPDAKPSAEWIEDIGDALLSISRHNIPDSKDEKKISYPTDALDFLLILCDHLQEWDRPHLEARRLRRSFSAALQRSGYLSPANTIVQYLATNLTWDRRQNKPYLSSDKLNLKLRYKDAGIHRFEPAMIWCQNSYELQHVILDNWPENFEISFEAEHPLSKELSENISLLEMDMFEDFVRSDDQCRTLTDWFDAAKDFRKGLKYRSNIILEPDGKKAEVFSWCFKKNSWGPIPIISEFPSGLFSRYVFWKNQRLKEVKLRKILPSSVISSNT